jgi:hypothetical protein
MNHAQGSVCSETQFEAVDFSAAAVARGKHGLLVPGHCGFDYVRLASVDQTGIIGLAQLWMRSFGKIDVLGNISFAKRT